MVRPACPTPETTTTGSEFPGAAREPSGLLHSHQVVRLLLLATFLRAPEAAPSGARGHLVPRLLRPSAGLVA